MEKVDIHSKENKKYINWIKDARDNGLNWEEILLCNKQNDEELAKFLENQKDNFWNINVEKWKALVLAHKKFIEECETVIISDPKDPEEIEIPEGGCFSTYIEKLKKNNFSQVSIDNIISSTTSILGRLKDSTEQSNPIRGLVMGNVQSGKTANMAALIALAADYGYNMFIVLTGTIENLRVQTEERLYGDLKSGKTTIQFQLLKDLSAKHTTDDLSNLHLESNSKVRYLNVCLKNSTRLKNLLNWINKDPKKKKELKILVIDDEADQAGVNTANIDKKLQTKISELIKKIVFAGSNNSGGAITPYKCMNYVAYTATPYANFLNQASNDSLYPKNFIATLYMSKEYFGPQQIFGSEDSGYKGLSIINEIPLIDVDILKSTDDYSIPVSLIEAVFWFICTVAVYRYWNIKKPVSMLIHTSQKQADHTVLSYMIKAIFDSIEQNVGLALEKIEEVWHQQVSKFTKEDFRNQYFDYDRLDEEIRDYPQFHQISNVIRSLISINLSHISLAEDNSIVYSDGIHLCIDNCACNSTAEDVFLRLAYPKSSEIQVAPAFIVIGGSTLSRGLTLEGLTTSYFVRNTQQADTLMQMGRWFGYRRGYELLPRLWLSKKTTSQFEFLSQLDEDLRIELSSMQMLGTKPHEYGPRINMLPKVSYLKVTSKKKMQKAIVVEGDYKNCKGQTTSIYRSEEIIKKNYNRALKFVNELGETDNNKIVNQFNTYSKTWLNIDYNEIFSFLKDLEYPTENSIATNMEFIEKWYKERVVNEEFGNWNVVLVGTSNGYVEDEFEQFSLRLVERSYIIKDSSDKVMKFGAISDPDAKKMDVDETNIDINGKLNYATYRIAAGYTKTPVLVLYFIYKNSMPGKGVKADGRASLSCENHVVGYEIYIPNGDNNKKNTGGKITVKLEFDLSSGDIDEE